MESDGKKCKTENKIWEGNILGRWEVLKKVGMMSGKIRWGNKQN